MLRAAGGDSARAIMFRLKLEPDPGNKAVADRFTRDTQGLRAQMANRQIQDAKRVADVEVREVQRATKAAVDESKKREQESMRYWTNESRAIDRHIGEHRRASDGIRRAQSGMRESFERSTEGVLKLGRGIVQLGLVGEKDAQKLINTLLLVEGGINLARGGIDIYRGLAGAVRGYREALLSAALAETALNAARSRGGTVAGVSSVAGSVGARTGLGFGARALLMGGQAVGGGRAALGATGAVGVGLAAAAAIGSVGYAGLMAGDYGGMRTEKANRWADSIDPEGWIARSHRLSVLGQLGVARPYAISQNRVERAAGARGIALERSQMRAGVLANQAADISTRFGIGFERATANTGTSPEALAQREQQMLRMRTMAVREVRDTEVELMAMQGASAAERATLEDRRRQAYDDLIRSEKELGTIREQSNEKALEGVRKVSAELERQRDAARSERERHEGILESARSRFANLDPLERRTALSALQRARQGGSLSDRERGILSSIGTTETEAIRRREERAIAERSGFAMFERPEQQAIAGARSREAAAAREIAVQSKIEVKLMEDQAQLAEQVVAKIEDALDKRDAKLLQEIDQRLRNAQVLQTQRDATRPIR